MSVEYQGNYELSMFNASKRYRLHFQKGVPLSSNELDEVQDVSDAYLKQFISANFPRASSVNTGFQVIESTSTDRNFTIKGGDGTVNGAGVLFVDGYVLFLKSDIEYEDQGNSGSLTDDDFTETFPAAPALTTPLTTRIDTVYVDFYFAEVSADPGSEYEDTSLVVPDIGFTTANRIRMVQDIRVAEGYCSTNAQAQYLSGTINIDGDFPSGVLIHVDGFDNVSGTVYEGTQFTIENDATIYTVTSDATISGNECDLSIFPTLAAAASDGEEVTFRIFEVGYPDGNDSNLIYHRYVRIATIIRDTSNNILTSMITDNRILINSVDSYSLGTTITDLIMSDGQSIGDTLHRVANIYMASAIDYSNDLVFTSTSERVRFTTSGRVGIGTTDPQSTLHVQGDLTLSGSSTTFDTELIVNDRVQINQDDNQTALEINQIGAGNTGTVVRISNAGTGHALIVSGGNVGIGTTNPAYTLHVVGDCLVSNNLTVNGTTTIINTEVTTADVLQIDQDDNQSALIVNQTGSGNSATVMQINNSGTGFALVTDNGNIGFGTTSPLNTLHVQGTSRITGNALFLSNVGIGTTNPLNDLHVQGISRVTGNAYLLSSVGIGTATALNTLHVQGISRVTGNALLLSNVGIGTTNPLTNLHVQGSEIVIGTVGIGTATALNTLHVQGTTRVTGDTFLLSNVGIGTANTLNNFHVQGESYFVGNVGIGTTDPLSSLHVQGESRLSGDTYLLSTVGIGTATALNTLHVQGTTRVTGDTLLLSNVGVGTANSLNSFHVQGESYFVGNVGIGTTDPLSPLHVQNSSSFLGKVGIGTVAPVSSGDVHLVGWVRHSGGVLSVGGADLAMNGILAVLSDVDNISAGFYRQSSVTNSTIIEGFTDYSGVKTRTFAFKSDRVYLQGNVGIGSTIPEYDLDVSGTARVSDGFYGPTSFNDDIIVASGGIGIGSYSPSESIDTNGDIILDSEISFRNNNSKLTMFTAAGLAPGRFTILEGTAGLGVIHLCHNSLSLGYPTESHGGYISIYGTSVVDGHYGNINIVGGNGGLGSGKVTIDARNVIEINAHTSDFLVTSLNFNLTNTTADFLTDFEVTGKVGIGTTVSAEQVRIQSDGSVGVLDLYRSTAIGGDIVDFRSDVGSIGNTVAKIDYTGQYYSDAGTTIISPADFAEWTTVKGNLDDYDLGTIVQQSEEDDLSVKLANESEFVYGVVTNRATFCGCLTECYKNQQMKNDFKTLSVNELEKKYNAKRIAMTGHIVCKVIGPVKRGQKLTLSEIKGVAKVAQTIEERMNAFAISRQNFESENEIGLIEIKL